MGRKPYSDRLTVEQCDQISIFDLKRNGILKQSSRADLQFQSRDGEVQGEIGLESHISDCSESYITLKYTAIDVETGLSVYKCPTVLLTRSRCQLGGYRKWFICPDSYQLGCERRVAILYRLPHGEHYACRS